MGGMATLELHGLRKSFGLIDVLHGIDLTLADGEMLVIVGASGCGKSTLLRLVAGLERPTAGRVVLEGRDVTQLDPSERDIAMVFQNYALYPHMTVFDNMAYGLRIRGLSRTTSARGWTRRPDSGVGRAAGAEASATVRRTAPAGGDGARDRAPSEAVPVRRTAVQPGRQAAPDDAGRDPAAAAPARRHQPVRHARPGGGDDAGRSAAGAASGPAGAARHANGGVRAPSGHLRRRLHRRADDELPAGDTGPRRFGGAVGHRAAAAVRRRAAGGDRWRQARPSASGRSTWFPGRGWTWRSTSSSRLARRRWCTVS